MQGDASGEGSGNGRSHRRRGSLLRAATHGLENWTNPENVLAVIEEAAELQGAATRRLRTLQSEQLPSSLVSPTEYIGIKEVACLTKRSVSTIRHAPPDYIPGRRQEVPGGRVEWQKKAVLRWREACTVQGT